MYLYIKCDYIRLLIFSVQRQLAGQQLVRRQLVRRQCTFMSNVTTYANSYFQARGVFKTAFNGFRLKRKSAQIHFLLKVEDTIEDFV
jgi:hypothetical protein